MSPSMVDPIKVVTGDSVATPNKAFAPELQDTKVISPTSDSSGDTLHDESSDVRSSGDGLETPNSPISPENLNFNGLTISGGGVDLRRDTVDRYTNPYQRGQKQHNEPSVYGPPGRGFGGNSRFGAGYNGRGGGGAGTYRNSRTWMSPDAQVQQEFLMIRNAMRRLFKNSDVSKWKLSDYVAHKEAMLASQANKLANQVKSKEDARFISSPISSDVQKTLTRCGLEGNFEEVGNYGRALGEQTIWCNDWENGKDEIAPWPSMAEMKWEGDDRAKTGVGRFLPLPREEGPPGLMWNQLPAIEQYPMDQVCKIPTMEDVYLPVDYHIEPDHEYLWNKGLEKEMDDFLES
ncbi:hypothetical protein J4E83_003572 [Alternaria metachromatica]|uniref:uncharacterized protein n=1 Tax=Alternaria metachromatica TaxID=283354 RepID=UPI0020C421F2|nr:uncharacterized protein J4E83_003572 [Alternaria metachromatica]KAI4626422.1 hypothetical protein J4E83_003572 [Alternaria metachromatica]